jgi:hypothetical protein
MAAGVWAAAGCVGTGSIYGSTGGETHKPTTAATSGAAASASGVTSGPGSTSSGTSGTVGSSTSGTTGGCLTFTVLDSGLFVPGECDAGMIEFATQVQNLCLGSTPVTEPIQMSNFYDMTQVANTDSCGNGYFCLAPGQLYSPLVTAGGFFPFLGAQQQAQYSQYLITYLDCLGILPSGLGIDPNDAFVVVEMYVSQGNPPNCPATLAGWSFTLTAPDGGAVVDVPLYATGTGLDPNATATNEEGTAVLANIDPTLGTVTLNAFFDGGPSCPNGGDSEFGFTGVLPLQAGTTTYAAFYPGPPF